MDRDVKPRNILISRNQSSRIDNSLPNAEQPLHNGNTGTPLMLIDLGLADFYLPNTRYNVRVASRHYKSPELLINYQFYDYGVVRMAVIDLDVFFVMTGTKCNFAFALILVIQLILFS